MSVKELHREAMRYNDLALIAKKSNELQEAQFNYTKAFDFEKQAVLLYMRDSPQEPTRSILLRSAANLAFLSEQYREAERLISLGLASEIPEELANDFRDLLQQINFHRHLELKGVVLNPGEMQLSLTGNEVGHGFIRSDEFLGRIETLGIMFYRTADRFKNKPFDEKGRPKKKDVISFEPYLSAPRAASFAITLRLGSPKTSLALEGMDVQSLMIKDVLSNIELINNHNYNRLSETIADPTYRANFIALTKKLAPDGDRVKMVGFTSQLLDVQTKVALVKTGDSISLPNLQINSVNKDEEAKEEVSVTGHLSFANSISRKIKITDSNNKNFTVEVPEGLLSDIVKPYFEDEVTITGTKRGKVIVLRDIKQV
jgi:hypothetical protein